MDFAKNLLSKYGWQEGDGLGKDKQGIAKPIKANLKFDQSGLGADGSSEFGNNWWERCFNDAAQNLKVKKEKNGEVKVDRKEDESVEVSTKSYSVKKLKNSGKGVYGNNFLSADVPVASFEMTKYKILTDEELFNACGGRTAHKGARHGLKLSGKLARIEQQEKELLARMKKRKSENSEIEASELTNDTSSIENEVTTDKVHKKKKRSKDTEVEQKTAAESSQTQGKKKKKNKIIAEENFVDNEATILIENKKKEKLHKKNKRTENIEEVQITVEESSQVQSKKKKNKSKDALAEEPIVKKKKSKKSNE